MIRPLLVRVQALACVLAVLLAGCSGDSQTSTSSIKGGAPPALEKKTTSSAEKNTTTQPIDTKTAESSTQSQNYDIATADSLTRDGQKAQETKLTDNGMTTPARVDSAQTDTTKTSPKIHEGAPTPDNSTSSSTVAGKSGSRVVLLTEGGPLLLEFQLTLNGHPVEEAFEEILAGIQQDADKDGDGRVSWDELTQLPRVAEGLLGNPRLESEREKREFIRQFDTNRNNLVDAQEWSRVFRQGSLSGRVFSVENRDDHRDWNRSASPLFALLDADGDQALNGEECDNAGARLLRWDADDDERLQPFEITSSRVEIPGMDNAPQRRSSGPYFAWHISPRTDWNSLIRACQITYAVGGPLATDCFPLRRELFAQLDADNNGRLSLTEFKQLAEIEPHIRVALRWGNAMASESSAEGASSPFFEITHWSPTLGKQSEQCEIDASGARLRLGTSRLEIFGREAAGDTAAMQSQQLLTQFDANKNAYLDGEEIDAALSSVNLTKQRVDRDGNEQVTVDELTQAFVSRMEATSAQVRAVVGHPEDALWVLLDDDQDSLLNGGELENAPARLLAQDRDGSGTITPDELVETVFLAVVRGDVPQGVVPPTARLNRPTTNSPSWFVRMDANEDGRLSRREFLGERTLFDERDKNHDDYLSLEEIQSPLPK